LRRKLPPKDIEPALAYAYYWATYGEPFKYFEPDGFYEGRFKGQRIAPSPLVRAKMAALSIVFPARLARSMRRLISHGYLSVKNRLRRAA
jgi:hypothetical protein